MNRPRTAVRSWGWGTGRPARSEAARNVHVKLRPWRVQRFPSPGASYPETFGRRIYPAAAAVFCLVTAESGPALKRGAPDSWIADALPPEPPRVRRQPLPVALSDRSAPALHWSCPVAKFRTDCPTPWTGKFTGKSEVSDCACSRSNRSTSADMICFSSSGSASYFAATLILCACLSSSSATCRAAVAPASKVCSQFSVVAVSHQSS